MRRAERGRREDVPRRRGLSTSVALPLLAAIVGGNVLLFACGGGGSSGGTDAGRDEGGRGARDATAHGDARSSRDGASGHDAGAAPDAFVAACTSSAAASCERLAQCYPNAISERYGDGGHCIARTTLDCIAAIEAPSTGRNVANETACGASYSTESCGALLNGDTTDACANPAGALGSGRGCAFGAQCQSTFCGLPFTSACGTCQATPQPDASCAEISNCGEGLACVKSRCLRNAGDGGACGPLQPCGSGLACVSADAGAGTCVADGVTVGATCDSKHETASECNIAAGLYCVSLKTSANFRTCQPVTLVEAGQPCGNQPSGANNVCANDSTCVKGADGGTTDRCVANAKDDAPCNTVTGPACERPARCVGAVFDGGTEGTCTLAGTTACP